MKDEATEKTWPRIPPIFVRIRGKSISVFSAAPFRGVSSSLWLRPAGRQRNLPGGTIRMSPADCFMLFLQFRNKYPMIFGTNKNSDTPITGGQPWERLTVRVSFLVDCLQGLC